MKRFKIHLALFLVLLKFLFFGLRVEIWFRGRFCVTAWVCKVVAGVFVCMYVKHLKRCKTSNTRSFFFCSFLNFSESHFQDGTLVVFLFCCC